MGEDPRSVGNSAVVVAVKWVQLLPFVDPLTGRSTHDDRFAGMSPADEAALELALRFAGLTGSTATVVTVGPPAAEEMLRHALACGAHRALRIDPGTEHEAEGGAQPTSAAVAAELASVCSGATMVWCGDWSVDRGSGTVPALLAHRLGIDQALGLVAVSQPGPGGQMRVERRLDGGRREVLLVDGPAVLSVEGAAATLRRASIAGLLAAKQAAVEVRNQHLATTVDGVTLDQVASHRPEPGPAMDAVVTDPRARVAQVLGLGQQRTPPLRLTLDPDAAADVILERLVAWGVTDAAGVPERRS